MAVDYDNIELDFDSLDLLVENDIESNMENDIDVIEDLDISDILQDNELSGSLSDLLGGDDELDLSTSENIIDNTNSNEYCPFNALNENSSEVITKLNNLDKEIDDGVDN